MSNILAAGEREEETGKERTGGQEKERKRTSRGRNHNNCFS